MDNGRVSSDEKWNGRQVESKKGIRKESSSLRMEVATGGTQRRTRKPARTVEMISPGVSKLGYLGSTRRDALWMRSDDSDRVGALTTNIGDDVPAFQR